MGSGTPGASTAGPAAGSGPAAGAAQAAADQVRTGPATTASRPRRLIAQARAIEADHRAKEAQAQRLTAARVQLVTATFAAVRARLTTTVSQAAAGFRGQVVAGQALLLATVTSVVATALTLVSGAATVLNARVAQTIGLVAGLVAGAVSAAQAGVRSVIGMITGLIDAVPLPDVPGVATIRAGAVAFLAGAAGVVTSTLDAVVSGVRAVAGVAVIVVTALVSQALVLVRGAVSRISAGLMRLVRTAASLLLRLAAGVAAALRLVLSVTVFPLLRRVELAVVGRLRWVLGHALRLLRRNRDQQLASLAELERSLPKPRNGATADPLDPEAASDAARVVADALANSSRVVRLLDNLTGGIVRTISGPVRDVVALVLSEIRRRLGLALILLLQVVTTMATVVRRTAAVVAEMLRSMVAQVVQGMLLVVDTVRQLVQRPLDALVSLAAGAVTRILRAVIDLVADLVVGVLGVTRDIRAIVLGQPASPPASQPVTAAVAPAAGGGLVVVVGGAVLTTLAVLAEMFAPVVAFAIVVYVTLEGALVAGITSLAAFLIGLGLSEFWAGVAIVLLIVFVVVAIIVIVVVLVILFLLLLWTVLRTLRNRRRRRDRKRVLAVKAGDPELGVGGPPVSVTATIAPGVPRVPPLTWTVDPGGTAPEGVSIVGAGASVQVRADHPAHDVITGGVPFVVRAELASDPRDCADSPDLMVVQVVAARYDAKPRLGTVNASLGRAPVNTVDPNRDKVTGSTAQVVATTWPARRGVDVTLRPSLDASVSGTTIKPGEETGDLGVQVVEQATGAALDPTRPALHNPALLMLTLVVNAVPTSTTSTRVTGASPDGPYGSFNFIEFASSDSLHPPLVRIVGELVTHEVDEFGVRPPNKDVAGGFNRKFHRGLATAANNTGDNLFLPYDETLTSGRGKAVDVNRFLGPGALGLPRELVYRQRFVWAAWRLGEVVSDAFVDGEQIKTLYQDGSDFCVSTRQVLGVASALHIDDYSGNRLIELSNIVVTPDDPGATALAADGESTGSAVVQTTVPGLFVRWTVPAGGVTVVSGNPSTPPAPATIGAKRQDGIFALRAEDLIYRNRQVDGKVSVAPVVLHHMSATPDRLVARVNVTADPGGRTLDWSLDDAAVAGGVSVIPPRTGPGVPQMWVLVLRPARFSGDVVVRARDRVLPTVEAETTVHFP